MDRKSITRTTGYDSKRCTYIPIVIIGAGESGIAMGCRLQDVLGFDQFRIYDRQSGVGGVWWINRYPGVACDVPAIFYSYSFSPKYGWSKFFPSGPEIAQYLQDVCNKYKLNDKVQLNSEVVEARWDEQEQVWVMTVDYMVPGTGDLSAYDRERQVNQNGSGSVYITSETIKARCLISAVGGLVEPNIWPDSIPGKDKFQGEVFHSARWRKDVDLKNKDVVVVGTGCSAAQFLPKLSPQYGVKSVTQVMRSPPWIIPRPIPPGGNDWWEAWSPWLCENVPGFQQMMRKLVFLQSEYGFRVYGDSEYSANERKKIQAWVLSEMKKVAPAKYHDILTPDYDIGCKRRVFDVEWLACLHDPKVELTTAPLTGVSERSVTLGPGRMYPSSTASDSAATTDQFTIPADVIILANGFQTSKWLLPLKVIGRHGQDLTDVFDERGGPQMYMGVALDDFPNFFSILGPNTGTGHSSALLAVENTVSLTLKLIRPIIAGEATTVEVKREAELAYTAKIQDALVRTVWQNGGCESWYKSKDTDWNGKTYPYSQIWYTLKCMFPTWRDWDIRSSRACQLKRWSLRVLRLSAIAALAVAAYGMTSSQSDQHAASWSDYRRRVSSILRSVLHTSVP